MLCSLCGRHHPTSTNETTTPFGLGGLGMPGSAISSCHCRGARKNFLPTMHTPPPYLTTRLNHEQAGAEEMEVPGSSVPAKSGSHHCRSGRRRWGMRALGLGGATTGSSYASCSLPPARARCHVLLHRRARDGTGCTAWDPPLLGRVGCIARSSKSRCSTRDHLLQVQLLFFSRQYQPNHGEAAKT